MTVTEVMTVTVDTTATSTFATAIGSMAHELIALFIFFITWAAVNHFVRKKDPSSEKLAEASINFAKRKQTPQEIVQVMQGLCSEQFTRGLRLYRQLVRTNQDKEIVDEAFYTAIVEAAIRVGKADVAEQVVVRMKENNMVPSTSFLQSLLKLFAARKCFRECINVWKLFDPAADQVVYSCLTLAASELGDHVLCREFLEISAKNFDVSSRDYVPLLRCHARRDDYETAVADLKALMQRGSEIESIVFNTTIAICARAKNSKLVRDLICEMKDYQKGFEKKCVDTVSYNTLMKALARERDVRGCFVLLEEICSSDIDPDDVTYSTILDVCIDEDENQLASEALDKMCASGVKMNCVLLTTLMKGFIRSKHLDMAMNLFESMQTPNSQVKPDMITYSMLIKAQCDVGDMGRALQILEDMLQHSCDVDDVVFTHLIEGCCHVGNVALAEKLYNDMLSAKINPSIYTLTAMVKVYGKVHQSDKAWEMVRTMEEECGIKPTVVIVTCLISGLLRQKKRAEAYEAFKWMEDHCCIRPDAQGVQTMINGLSEAAMLPELIDVMKRALDPARRPALRIANEVLNNALQRSLSFRNASGYDRQIYKLLVNAKVDITVPNIGKRMGVGLN